MGLGEVAIATLPSVIFPKLMFSDGLGGGRCESGLSCIKSVGPIWQANPDCQAAYLHPYRTFQIQCELGAEYQT